jgi:hypothetical protein
MKTFRLSEASEDITLSTHDHILEDLSPQYAIILAHNFLLYFLICASVSESQVLCHLFVNSGTNLSFSAHGNLRFLQWIDVDKPGRGNGHRVGHPPPSLSQQRENVFV